MDKVLHYVPLSMLVSLLASCSGPVRQNQRHQLADRIQQSDQSEQTPRSTFQINFRQPEPDALAGIGANESLQSTLVIAPTRRRCNMGTMQNAQTYQPGQSITLEFAEACDLQVYLVVAPPGVSFIDSDRVLGYQEDIVPLLDKYCYSCHNANSVSTSDLSTQEQVYGRLQKIRNHVVAGTMPPEPATMYPDEVWQVSHWIDQGTPVRRSGEPGSKQPPMAVSKQIRVDGDELQPAEPITLDGLFKRVE